MSSQPGTDRGTAKTSGRNEIAARIAEIIAEQVLLEPEEIGPETRLDELGLDSLALVEIIFGIEEAFGIAVPFNANEPAASQFDISTVDQIIAGVKQLLDERV